MAEHLPAPGAERDDRAHPFTCRPASERAQKYKQAKIDFVRVGCNAMIYTTDIVGLAMLEPPGAPWLASRRALRPDGG